MTFKEWSLKVLEALGGIVLGGGFIALTLYVLYNHHFARDLQNNIKSHKGFWLDGEERFCQFTERQQKINDLKKQLLELQRKK